MSSQSPMTGCTTIRRTTWHQRQRPQPCLGRARQLWRYLALYELAQKGSRRGTILSALCAVFGWTHARHPSMANGTQRDSTSDLLTLPDGLSGRGVVAPKRRPHSAGLPSPPLDANLKHTLVKSLFTGSLIADGGSSTARRGCQAGKTDETKLLTRVLTSDQNHKYSAQFNRISRKST